jgi:putative transcriptional regulator
MRTTSDRASRVRPSMTPLRRARVLADLTLTELAAASGVSRMTIYKLERLGQSPTLETAQNLARALESSVDTLFPIPPRAELEP